MRKITMLMMTVSAALAIALGAAQKDSRADAQLQAAINKETVEGDLKSAIEMYKKVAQSGNRAAAAKALVRMGQCYEKLGDAEARKAYERVVASYADQRDVAAEARTRLAAMGGRTTGAAEAVARRVWTGKEADTTGTPSLDSRYLSYVHRPTGDLALRDLSTGENRLVTNKGPRDKSWQFADMNVISPDGKLLAYSWCVEGKPLCDYELRVSAPDGSGMKVLFHSTQMEFWGRPCAITPDNKYVLTALEKGGPPNTTRIAFIAVSDGSIRDLKTIKTGTQKDRLVLSPDGRFVAYSQPSGRVGNNLGKPLGYKNIYVLPAQGGAEIPLVADPSDDKVLGWMPDGKSILFSSNRSGTYDAWLLPVENGKAAGPPRLAKRNIGVDAWPLGFTRDSAFYYGRRTGSSDMYMVTLDQATSKPAGEPTLVLDRHLGSNARGFFSPDGKWLSYLYGQKLMIRSFETGEEREPFSGLFFGPFDWHTDGRSLLAMGSSPGRVPDVYKLDTQNGQAKLLFAGPKDNSIANMQYPVWSRDGKVVYYGLNERNQMQRLMAHNVDTGEEKELFHYKHRMSTNLAVSPDGRQIAFADKGLLVMPVEGGEPRAVLAKPDLGVSTVAWSADGRFLYYFARDKNQFQLFRIPAEGGQPENLGVQAERAEWLSVHPDGRRLIYSSQRSESEVWVLENLR